jgi:hypothetical protein
MSRLRRGKSRPRGSPAERHFGEHRALGQDRVDDLVVLGRIDAVVAAGEHRDRAGREA